MESEAFKNPDYWLDLAPSLTIEGQVNRQADVKLRPELAGAMSDSMASEGYLHLPPVFGVSELEPIRDAISALTKAELPAVFIYIYDQPWALFQRLQPIISAYLGDRFALLPNFWAWHIPTDVGASGWPVHQDCSGQTRFVSSDGETTLMSLSLWVPLTDATTDNGCMYVLPRSREAMYPNLRADPDQINPDQGLALPAKAGSVLGWSQDLFHWSGRVTDKAENPRYSLSLEFQNPTFEAMAEPLLDVANPPPFAERLQLIIQQFQKYRHMETVPIASQWQDLNAV